MQRVSIRIIHSKSPEKWKGWMGGQVEVNKEVVGMERQEMRVVSCENDLESSQGAQRRGRLKEHRSDNKVRKIPRDKIRKA